MHTVLGILGSIGLVLGWVLLALLAVLVLLLVVPVSVTLELKNDAFTAKLRVLGFSIGLFPPKEKQPKKPKKKKKPPAAHKTEKKAEAQQAPQTTQGQTVPKAPDDRAVQTAQDDPAAHASEDAAPAPLDGEKPGPEKEPLADAPKEEKPKKKGGLPSLDKIAELASTAGWLMRIVLKCLHVRNVKTVWPVHKEDAAQTAIAFGQTQAYLGAALGVLQNVLDIRLKQVDIIPDFTGEWKDRRYFYCKIQAVPFIMIVAAVYALVHLKADKVI